MYKILARKANVSTSCFWRWVHLSSERHYSPIDQRKRQAGTYHAFERTVCDSLGEVSFVVVPIVVVVRRVDERPAQQGRLQRPADEPPDDGEALEDQQRDPVVECWGGVDGDEVVG